MRLLSPSLDVTMLLLLQETYINEHNYLQKMNTKMEALAKAYCFYTFENYQNRLFCHF